MRLKTYDDPKLARRIAIARGFYAAVAVLWVGLVIHGASSGTVSVQGNTKSRGISGLYTRDVTWVDSPYLFSLGVLQNLLYGLGLLAACYFLTARFLEWWNRRRPFFRKKYPY